MQLDAALVLPGPHVGQRTAELGVPEQRRQVLQDHGHAHVVDRGVGERPDRPVGQRGAAEDPHVAGAGEVDRSVQGQLGHGGYVRAVRLWKLLGLAGLAGVAATGAVLARGERQRRAHTPEEIRPRLRERHAALADVPDPVTSAELVSGRGHRLARVLRRR